MTEEEFLKRKEAADTHDEEAAEVNIYLFFSSNHIVLQSFNEFFLFHFLAWGGKKSDIVPLYRMAVPFQPIFQCLARVSPSCS